MSSGTLARVRLAIAAIVVLASLLAVSAWLKSATCDCGSRGLPWDAIALASTVVAGTAIAAYAALSMVARHTA